MTIYTVITLGGVFVAWVEILRSAGLANKCCAAACSLSALRHPLSALQHAAVRHDDSALQHYAALSSASKCPYEVENERGCKLGSAFLRQ